MEPVFQRITISRERAIELFGADLPADRTPGQMRMDALRAEQWASGRWSSYLCREQTQLRLKEE